MIFRHSLAATMLVFVPFAVVAQDEVSRDDCQRVLDSFRAPGAAPEGLSVPIRAWADDGWCVVQGLTFVTGEMPNADFRINRIRWRGTDIAAISNRQAPLSLDLRIEGFRRQPRFGMPAMDYVMRARAGAASNAIDAKLSIRRDPGARTVTIENLAVDFPGENALVLSATVAQVDLSSPGAAQMSVGSAGLTDLSLAVTSNGLFETYVMMSLWPRLLGGVDDPEARVDELRGKAKTALTQVPPAILPAASQAALDRFLDDLPNPEGTAQLRLQAPDGIGAGRFVRFVATGRPMSVADFVTALAGVNAEFSYEK